MNKTTIGQRIKDIEAVLISMTNLSVAELKNDYGNISLSVKYQLDLYLLNAKMGQKLGLDKALEIIPDDWVENCFKVKGSGPKVKNMVSWQGKVQKPSYEGVK